MNDTATPGHTPRTTLIRNIRFAGDTDACSWILVDGDRIAAVGRGDVVPAAQRVVDGQGALAMPGAIDCHVHFREPGLTHKADILSESRAAVAGGVTSYFEMPNTKPPTTTLEAWQQKMDIAAERSYANYAFFIGATNDNLDLLKSIDYTRVPGVKLFMGSSTGNMLVDDTDTISRIFAEVDAVIAVHAEDQDIIARNTEAYSEGAVDGDLPVEMHTYIRSVAACYNATQRAVQLARRYGRRLHVCHISTAAELSLLAPGDPAAKLITAEVSPHHLMWSAEDYATRGSRIKMNPSVKETADRHALIEAVSSGLIDIVATDHAPHLLDEKRGGALKAVSGAPAVQFSLPWMLSEFDPRLVQRLMCHNPARVFGIEGRGFLQPGCYADVVLLQRVDPYTVGDTDVVSKCGWTPLDSSKPMEYKVVQTWVNGACVFDGGVFADLSSAAPLEFSRRNPASSR